MNVDMHSNSAWLDIVDHLSVDLDWSSDPDCSEASQAFVAHFGDEIVAKVWAERSSNGFSLFSSTVTWRDHKKFSTHGKLSLAAAKESARLGALLFVAEILYDTSTNSEI